MFLLLLLIIYLTFSVLLLNVFIAINDIKTLKKRQKNKKTALKMAKKCLLFFFYT